MNPHPIPRKKSAISVLGPHKNYKDKQKRSEYLKDYHKKYRAKNSERLKKYWKQYHSERKEKYKNLDLLRKYKISKKEYDKILDRQKGSCAICGLSQSKVKYYLSVDHDHKTGKVRGILCNNCNRCIGLLKDDIKILKRAIIYLK